MKTPRQVRGFNWIPLLTLNEGAIFGIEDFFRGLYTNEQKQSHDPKTPRYKKEIRRLLEHSVHDIMFSDSTFDFDNVKRQFFVKGYQE